MGEGPESDASWRVVGEQLGVAAVIWEWREIGRRVGGSGKSYGNVGRIESSKSGESYPDILPRRNGGT